MANSSIIETAKNSIVREIINDEEIVNAIDARGITLDNADELIGKHVFDYHQNPNVLQDMDTFITIQVDIPPLFRDTIGLTRVRPNVEIWICSHYKHMRVENVPKIKSNRNDYLSRLLDKKLNGSTKFGIGKLNLTSNIEGSYQNDYLYRTLTFETLDINNSLCEDDD